ncbi:MAG TPA: type II secretion system minor pseudopilin GspK [Candidatus Hydrogenedentes bacterium]|nr:type II secretion system minor pseudopilin GspK [Candidatus Hydrogenedentota bacterium]
MMRTNRGHKKGVALILALLFIALLTVIVIEFSYESQVEASFATNQGSDFQAYLAAKSAVARAIGLLATDLADTELNGEPEMDSMIDPIPWAQGQPFEPLNDATMRASISDEYGKINLNALLDTSLDTPKPRDNLRIALEEFFIYRMEDSEDAAKKIVDCIIDWLDYNDDDDEEDEGAENDYYSSLDPPFACKNGPMDSIEELLLIKHMTPEIYFGDPDKEQLPLSEYLTVHGDWQGRVNINTAREEVIAAMNAAGVGISGAPGVFDIEEARAIREQVLNEPYTDASQFNRRRPGTTEGEKEGEISMEAGGGLRVNSNMFRIYGDGMLEDIMVRIEAYVWRTPLTPEEEQEGIRNQGNPPVNQNVPITGDIPMEATTQPSEKFRILDWRVIR